MIHLFMWQFEQALSRSLVWSRWKNGRFLCMQSIWNCQARRRGMCTFSSFKLVTNWFQTFINFKCFISTGSRQLGVNQNGVDARLWVIVGLYCNFNSLRICVVWRYTTLLYMGSFHRNSHNSSCSMMKQSEEGKWLRTLLNATPIIMNAGLLTNLWVPYIQIPHEFCGLWFETFFDSGLSWCLQSRAKALADLKNMQEVQVQFHTLVLFSALMLYSTVYWWCTI